MLTRIGGFPRIGALMLFARDVSTRSGIDNVNRPLSFMMCLLASGFVIISAFAHDYKTGDIVIEHPWARATPPGAANGAGYLVLKNHGQIADELLAVSSVVADRVEVHTHVVEEDVMKMRKVDSLEILPDEEVVLAPGGLHLMLIDLKHQLTEGETFPVELTFEHAGSTTIEVKVQKDNDDKQGEHQQHTTE